MKMVSRICGDLSDGDKTTLLLMAISSVVFFIFIDFAGCV